MEATKLAMAQDYWHQVMTMEDRIKVLDAVPYRKREGVAKRYHRILAYVYETYTDKVIAHQEQFPKI